MSERVYYAIHYGLDERGYIAYDEATKEATVVLPDPEWTAKVEAYLQAPRTLENATGLNEYETVTVQPLASLDDLKLALTRLWTTTDVQVDWSRPVEIDGVMHFPK